MLKRDDAKGQGEVCGQLGSGGEKRWMAQPQCFGSKWRLCEGGRGRARLGLRGSYDFWVFMKRGVKSIVLLVCTEQRQRPFSRSPPECGIPSMPGVYMKPLNQGLFRYQNPNRTNAVGEEMTLKVHHRCPAVPVCPVPYSFSSRISTMSAPSSAGGMSVMAESSPSAAVSFSIFFFCFR